MPNASAIAAADSAEERVLELAPEQLESFKGGLEMLDTSLGPQIALRGYLAKSAADAVAGAKAAL